MITKYQAMMATLPVRSVSCEVQAVEDRVRTLRHTLFMLEELDMLTFTECRTLAKPLYALENQVYRLLSEINDAELQLVRYAQQYDSRMEWQEHARKYPPSVDDLVEWAKQNPHFFGE